MYPKKSYKIFFLYPKHTEMTGIQLEALLFPKSSTHEKSGEKAAFGRYCQEKAGYKNGRQTVNKFFNAEKPSTKLLQLYAEFKGYKNPQKFVEWAKGGIQIEPYSENGIQIEPHKNVSEPASTYTKNAPVKTLETTLIEVMKENVSLHKSLASRGELVIKLLDKTWTGNP